jgi:hypothetical protein
LWQQVEVLTTRHQQAGVAAMPPPAVAVHSPWHEVLVAEVAASLPPPVAERLRQAPTVAAAHDWIAAGALYSWLGNDPALGPVFLREVGEDPRRAGLALARAVAARMELPPRTAAWHSADRRGLALAVAAAGLLLGARALLFAGLALLLETATAGDWWSALFGVDIAPGRLEDGLIWAVVPGLAALWLGLEAICGPRLLEHLRGWPARRRGLPPPLSWRADALHALWYAQAAGLLLVWTVRCGIQLVQDCLGSEAGADQWSAGLILMLWLVAVLAAVWQSAAAILKVGTGDAAR